MAKPHRATGNPRGRPPKIPFDFGQRIMENLRQRVDPKTGLVRPRWKQMAWDLGVSRSTIARQMAELYACGAYERIYIKVNPRVTICYYRLSVEGLTTVDITCENWYNFARLFQIGKREDERSQWIA